MGSSNFDSEVNEYASWLIERKARQLVGKAGFVEDDREDLEQELLLDLHRRLRKYNRAKSQLRTFIARVVDHGVATLIEARSAGIRDYRLCTSSLNQPLESDDGDFTELGETIDRDDYLLRTGRVSRQMAELGDISIDLRRVMDRLPAELRDLCRRLQTSTIAEISRDTGISRGTLYERRNKVRAAFEEAGLRNYL